MTIVKHGFTRVSGYRYKPLSVSLISPAVCQHSLSAGHVSPRPLRPVPGGVVYVGVQEPVLLLVQFVRPKDEWLSWLIE